MTAAQGDRHRNTIEAETSESQLSQATYQAANKDQRNVRNNDRVVVPRRETETARSESAAEYYSGLMALVDAGFLVSRPGIENSGASQ